MSTFFMENGEVALRPLEKGDAEFLQKLINSSEVRAGLGRTPEPKTVNELEQRIEEQADDSSIIQLIIEKEHEKVGTIALFDIDRDYRKAEFGAFMVDPDRQGEGIGTEALELLLEYAFDELNLHRVEGGHLEDREASRRVQEKLGFKEEGRQRDAKYRDGGYIDVVRLGILEDEWRSE